MGGEQQKVGEEGEEKGNCWNSGKLPCDNLFGSRKHGSGSKPPQSEEGEGSSLSGIHFHK